MANQFNTPFQSDKITQSIARAGEQYDEVPYSSFPFARLQPERLAAVARLLGTKVSDPQTARTLEIGCASGGHLIPLAARYRDAQFVGIDVSQKQIADGQARVERLGLNNITLEKRSLTELGEADGVFDYIICHGVYSWIPDEVRESLMQACHDRLAPEGVAVISYNVLPGWRMYQVVRDSMILHAGGKASHAERTAEMRKLFGLLAEHTNESTTYAAIWRKEAPRMAQQPDAYLAHELLEDNNAPCTFSDFVAAAKRHGLGYLGETTLMAGIPENSGAVRGALIRDLAGDDPLAVEQYIDIVVGRTFRQSMLVDQRRAQGVERSLREELLDDLHLIAPLSLKVTASGDAGPWSIDDGEGSVSETADPAAAEAVKRLVARLPASSTLNDLAPPGQASAEDRNTMREGLMRLLCMGMIEASTCPINRAAGVSLKPKVWPLAISDAEAGLDHTATLRHAPFEITPQARFLMPLANGTRDRGALIGHLFDFVIGGGVQISEHGVPVTDPDRLKEICRAAVDKQLTAFARAGLLVEDSRR